VRPISMASFLVSDNAWPSEEFGFKYVNLMVHLMNALLIFYFVLRICRVSKVLEHRALLFALFASSLWVLHPFNVSTTLYVVQRMTQLSALFSLLSMIFYIVGRDRVIKGLSGGIPCILIALVPFAICAVLSKENGVLVYVQILFIETVFYSEYAKSKSFKRIYNGFVLAPVLLFTSYLLFKFPSFLERYNFRDFDMLERIMTQSRYLFHYLSYIFVPNGTGTGLINDDLGLSTGLLSPISTAASIIGWLLIIVIGYLLRKKAVLCSYGIGFFLIGHALESTFLPLELYFEHRNYLPMVGVLLFIVGGANALLSTETKSLGRFLVGIIFVLYIGSASAVTQQQVKIWSNLFDLLTMWATEHPDSLRAQRIYGQYLGRGRLWALEGQDVLSDAYEKFPDDISLPIIMLNTACKQGVESPVKLDEVLAATSRAYYHGGLMAPVKNLANNYISGSCATTETSVLAHEILLKLSDAHGMRGPQKADLTFFHAEKYAMSGNLPMAMSRLEVAELNQKDFVVPFRQASYLASAGLYDEALERIQRSRELDERRKRKWLVPSNDKIISLLESQIVTAQNSSNNRDLQ